MQETRETITGPDLRTSPPSSVHATFHGVVMLARVTDKAKAAAFGQLGEYTYNCPLDRAVLGYLGMDGDAYLRVIRAAESHAEIDAYVDSFVSQKPPAELAAWNEKFIRYVPAPESDSWARLVKMREHYAPGREDIVNWADVLDLEEGRDVPLRIKAPV
jgi:hypothetical protein